MKSFFLLQIEEVLERVYQGIKISYSKLLYFLYTECPIPTTPLANPPRFSSSNYIFTTFTNTTGSLGVVRAYSSSMDALFYYTLEVESGKLYRHLQLSLLY